MLPPQPSGQLPRWGAKNVLPHNDGQADQHLDYHHGTADIRRIMHWAGTYTEDADIVIEYEPHEKLTHAELLDEIYELKSWVEEGKALF